MAIFERRIERKVTLDDTQTLSCLIETAQKVDGHTEYVLRVQRGLNKTNSWRVLRRYNDFAALNKCLQISGVPLQLPGKKIIGNMHPEFIAQRRLDLQNFLNTVLMNPILASSLPTKKFVDPDNYSNPFHDLALQNASLCLRSDGLYSLGQSLGPIGWRLRKHYFKVVSKAHHTRNSPGQSNSKHQLVKSGSQSQSKHNGAGASSDDNTPYELVLCWIEYGPDKHIDDKEIHNVFRNLAGCQHPYIQPIEYVSSNDSGALIIRKFTKQGSIKDILCGVTPFNPFLTKYGNPKGRTALPLKEVAIYGRQILEALRFLHSKGIPSGHIHAGNVMIIDGVARLLDIENFLLGVPSFYRPFFVQHTKICTFEAIDVYSFGHLMYEMSMGYPLQESIVRQVNDCPESLKSLLELILSREACKNGLPTLDQLAGHQFFTEHVSNFNEAYTAACYITKPHLKFSTNAKEQLKNSIQKTENRLRDEQKSVKNQKRLVRVQELMSSEEEKKKIKHKAKLEHKQAKLRQQNSLQLQNEPPALTSSVLLLNRCDSVNSVAISHDSVSSTTTIGTQTQGYQSAATAANTDPSTISTASPSASNSGVIVHSTVARTNLPPSMASVPPPPAPPPLLRPLNLTKCIGGDSLMPLTSTDDNNQNRSALFDSICKFNKSALRHTNKTNGGD